MWLVIHDRKLKMGSFHLQNTIPFIKEQYNVCVMDFVQS